MSITALLALVCVPTAWSVTCTPINKPAVIVQGQTFQQAIVNGIDNVSYSSARVQWTSDASTNPINYQRLVYTDAAHWAANGNQIIAGTPGVNYSIGQPGTYSINSDTTIQGLIMTNLADSTTYHYAGQSSGDGGATFCPVVDHSFTTTAFTGIVPPTLPTAFKPTPPTVTGTDRTLGVGGCTDLQTCINLSAPGDGIGIPPGSPAIVTTALMFPNNPNAIPIASFTGSVFNATAHGLTNGTLVHIGVDSYNIPSPINEGQTYNIVNAHTNDFQISLDGTNPITLNDAGLGTVYVIRWPISQNYILIHSTASSSTLPPAGVRLDPVAYGSQLGKIQLSDRSAVSLLFFTKALNSFIYFKNIEFDTLPAAPATETDPIAYNAMFVMDAQADHIVFDQCYFKAAPPPDRIRQSGTWAGTNQAIINSYFENVAFWKTTKNPNTATTVGSTTISLPAFAITYPTTGNTKVTCSTAGTTATFGGTAGDFYVYFTIAPCALTIQAKTGVTVTGSGFTVTHTSTPTYPVDAAAIPTVLEIGNGTWSGSGVSYADQPCGISQCSTGSSEGGGAIGMNDGPGPFNFSNNYFPGVGIVGVYKDEYIGTTCQGWGHPCPLTYNVVNFTQQRNTITWDPHYNPLSPSWNGSWWFGRNADEFKTGSRVLIDANIIGPVFGGVSNAECQDIFTYYDTVYVPDNVNIQATDDITWTNNTCYSAGSSVTMGTVSGGKTVAKPITRVKIYNNLFNRVNGYAQNPDPTTSNYAGRGILVNGMESVSIDHNTFFGLGGLTNGCVVPSVNLSGGVSVTNNICNYNSDLGIHTGAYYYSNFGESASQLPIPSPAGFTEGTALLALMKHSKWSGNVVLCQWSNSNPANPVEMTKSDCAASAALYPPPPATYFPNAGSTLADRISAMQWSDPANGNFRFNYHSPYISGARASADGLDVGVDMDALEAAQGKVTNVHIYGTASTSTTVAFTAPDVAGCTVDFGTADFPSGTGSWTRVPNAGGQRTQSVALSGLVTKTTYTYRVNCAVSQPTGKFTTD